MNPQKSRWRTPIALLVSVGWLVLGAWWVFRDGVPGLQLDQWGDLAGGAFAPLAFLWLVVGYLQQGEELRDNVRALHLQEEALRLQVQELKESVQQQTAVATAAARQADLLETSHQLALRAQVLTHQPRLVYFRNLGRTGPDGNHLTLGILNVGQACYDAAARISNAAAASNSVVHYWGKDSEKTFTLSLAESLEQVVVEINYVDEVLVAQQQSFSMTVTRDKAVGDAFEVELLHMSFRLPAALPAAARA